MAASISNTIPSFSSFRPQHAPIMPGLAASGTCWREVTAKVHVSLSPQELSAGGKAAATRVAFQSLLMRYSPELEGVAVAHRGGLIFKSSAVFVGASPYAHLVATARLLVFAPPPGAELVGVVTHVGPDHVGLSVLQAFHAVLPLEPLREFYAYDYRVGENGLVRKWRCLQNTLGFDQEVTSGRQVRFVVEGMKHSHTGLFQIRATLDQAKRSRTDAGNLLPLGVLRPSSEVVIAIGSDSHATERTANGQGELPDEDAGDSGLIGEISVSKRAVSSRVRGTSLPGQDALMGNPFGNALMPMGGSERRKSSKKKKRRESSGESRHRSGSSKKKSKKSVKFEDEDSIAKKEPESVMTVQESQVPVLTQTELGSRDETVAAEQQVDQEPAVVGLQAVGLEESLKVVRSRGGVGNEAVPSPTTEKVAARPLGRMPGDDATGVEGRGGRIAFNAQARADARAAVDIGRRASESAAASVIMKQELSIAAPSVTFEGEAVHRDEIGAGEAGSGGSGKVKKRKKRKREAELVSPGTGGSQEGERKKKKKKKHKRIASEV